MNSKILLIVICLLTISFVKTTSASEEPKLLPTDPQNFFLVLKNSIDTVLIEICTKVYPSLEAKSDELRKALIKATEAWQKEVKEALDKLGLKYQVFWIINTILVFEVPPDLIEVLRKIPSVIDVILDGILPFPPIQNPTEGAPPKSIEWNIKKVKADKVWEKSKGKGVLVAVIDSGVRATHEALKGNFVKNKYKCGDCGWFDAIFGKESPHDTHGHGSHCTGVICGTGTNGISVAPAATWMACLACNDTSCTKSALIKCGEWTICPTNSKGENPNCALTPHLVSNSWGGGQNDPFYNDIIKVWNCIGTIPIFAIGNSGKEGCGTASSPGDQKGVISVGSTNKDDIVSDFSSRGPSKVPGVKVAPQIVAPGQDINSVWPTNDQSYKVISGTSMAAPHVAGAVALLLSCDPLLTLAEIEDILFTKANKKVTATEPSNCDPDKDPTIFPNNVAGNGRLDCFESFKEVQSKCS